MPHGGVGQAMILRPEWLSLGGPFAARVASVWYRGGHTDHVLDTSVGQVTIRLLGGPAARPGERVSWSVDRAWMVT